MKTFLQGISEASVFIVEKMLLPFFRLFTIKNIFIVILTIGILGSSAYTVFDVSNKAILAYKQGISTQTLNGILGQLIQLQDNCQPLKLEIAISETEKKTIEFNPVCKK